MSGLPQSLSTPIVGIERRVAPYYPVAALFGLLFFVASLTLGEGLERWIALVWVVLVPLWISRYNVYRASR